MAITSLFPILRTTDLPALYRFYTRAFDATIPYRYEDDGIEVYVALAVGGGTLGIGLEPAGTERAAVWLYTDDVDAAHEAALAAGAESVARPTDMPWGERVAQVRDPDGNLLYLGRAADDTGTS